MDENEKGKKIRRSSEAETPERPEDFIKEESSAAEKTKRKVRRKILIAVALCACVLAAIGIYGISQRSGGNKNTITGPLAAQIGKYYVPFNASKYEPVKYDGPGSPLSYKQLLMGDAALGCSPSTVILCTVENIGVFREKAERYNPRASFGTYIYTVKVDKVFTGKADPVKSKYAAVIEKAVAAPGVFGWSFCPFTRRPVTERLLKTNEQYVMYLLPKDHTGCYPLAMNGFGVFSSQYIGGEVKKDSLNTLENRYDQFTSPGGAYYGQPLPSRDTLLYKISALHVYDDFLSKS